MAQDNLTAYANWLVQNKDKKGTPEFDKVARAFQMLQAAGPRQAQAPVNNPDGTGVSRAATRGWIRTTQAPDAVKATQASNTLRGMDVNAITSLNRVLDRHLGQYPEILNQIRSDEIDMLANVPMDRWLNYLGSQYDINPKVLERIGIDASRIEVGKEEMRQDGGFFDQQRAKGETALTNLQEKQDRIDALPLSPTAQRGLQDFQEADGVMEWAKSSFKDPLGALAFIGEVATESAVPLAAGVGTSVITGNPLAGAGVMVLSGAPQTFSGEFVEFLREQEIDLSDPQQIKDALSNDDILRTAAARGYTKSAIISLFEALGMKAGAGILTQGARQFGTGFGGEASSDLVLNGEIDFKNATLEGIAEFATFPVEAAILYKNGKMQSPGDLPDIEAQTAASLAQRIRRVSKRDGWNLKDVGPNGDAKQALEAAHESISGEIKEIVANPAVKKYLNPKQAATLDQLIDDYAAAQVAIRQGKNKVKSKVTKDNFDAIMRLLPPTVEAQKIANLFREGNQLTDLFKNGTKGGLSQFTDTFNPFTREDGSYDPSKAFSGLANKGVAIATMGQSLPYQFGAVGAGRAIDAVTGRRAAVERFVRKNEGNDTLPEPVGPSLIAAERLKKEQEASRSAELGALPQVDKDNSPVGSILSGTGLDREGLKTVMTEIEAAFPDVKALEDVFGDIRKNLDGGTNKIRNLNDIIPIINQHLNTPDTVVKRAAAPDQLLAQRGGVNIPNINQTPPQRTEAMTEGPEAPEFGPKYTTPENYNRGIEANRTAAKTLDLQAQNDPNLSVQNKAVITSALDKLQGNLGANPVMNAEAIVEAAVNAGVPQEAIDTYVQPYVDRVIRQQAARTPPTIQEQSVPEAPTVDETAPEFGPDVETGAPAQPTEEQTPTDPYDQAIKAVIGSNAPNIKTIQKATGLSYNESARLLERMEADGIVTPMDHVGRRKINRVAAALRNAPPRMAMAPQEDAPAVDPKRPQAPRLAPDQIPTETRKVYKLMKVQKSRPNEVLPLFAKSGGHKGPPSGYTFGEWFASEFQRPKLGAGLLAPRSGIHGVNLPVFDQGKAKVKGAQRVWVEAEIPSINPETQAQSDNSFNPKRKANDGILNRVLDPNESYDYKTNPNASNDAGGWPIAGSVKILRIVPDNEIAQILRDNGLDHQIENSFTDVDEAKAQELMQPATPVRMAMAPEEDIPVPRGETTNIQMPNQLGSAFEFAKGSNFSKGRDFKLALQEKALAAQKEEGIDLSTLTDENIDRLADYVVADALVALQDNSNAIGWYDRTVTDALTTLSEVYPEIQTNPKNKLQFIWALAVTSNGTKVDKNFELAATAYDHLQRTGRFPTNIGIGEAARAINGGLQQYHTMLEKFERKTNSDEGDHQLLADFMNSQVPVKQIEQEYGVKISGEGKNTLVRGASILGPKIGNGFFSNLYGNFDALTMDRWLMRTVGRHRGTLVKINQPMIKQKVSEIKTMLKDASPETMKGLRRIFKPTGTKVGKSLNTDQIHQLAARIAKESTSADWRTELNGVSEDLRKAGNALAKYLDGQVEAPAGAKERDFIRSVFQQALERLNTEPSVTRASNAGLTMSDLQALLWYPEKRLYDSSKAPEGQESRGYADDEAPDYANAARKLVESRQRSSSGSGLGPSGPDGPRGGGASSPNARPALAPVRDGVAGALAQRIAGGPAGRTPVPSTQEVKQAAEPVRQALSVGLKGSEFENGIKNIDQVRKLADAIGVVLKMTDDQGLINKIAGYDPDTKGVLGVYHPAMQEAYALNPNENVSEFQSYITALHEVAHGVADMSGDNFLGLFGDYKKPDGTVLANPMTEIPDVVRQNSFDDKVSRMLIMYKQGLHQSTGRAAQAERKKIVTEMRKLQDKGKYDNGSDVRYVGGARTRDAARRDTPYYKYIRRGPEFAVDPLIFYMHNPKRMKQEFPATAKMIREFFANSGKINFYSHPLAMAIAAVLAMMMKAEQEEEKKKQMPAGALNQPMPMGALSQA